LQELHLTHRPSGTWMRLFSTACLGLRIFLNHAISIVSPERTARYAFRIIVARRSRVKRETGEREPLFPKWPESAHEKSDPGQFSLRARQVIGIQRPAGGAPEAGEPRPWPPVGLAIRPCPDQSGPRGLVFSPVIERASFNESMA